MDNKMLNEQKRYFSKCFSGSVVLVSGATGMIGSRIVNYLTSLNDELAAKIKVIALYRSEQKLKKVFGSVTAREDIKFCLYDIEKHEAFKLDSQVDKVDYIIHCAGIPGGAKMHLKDPVRLMTTIYNGTKTLLNIATEHHSKGFVYLSSYEVYGNSFGDEMINESAPCFVDTMELRNIYAETKRFCETLTMAYAEKYNINTYCARLTSTFGSGVTYNDTRFFAEFARCIIENRDIVLKSTGGTIRSYLDVDDAVTAFLYILTDGKSKNTYNLTNMNNAISIKDMADKMIQLSESSISVRFDIPNDADSTGYRKEGCTLINSEKLMSIDRKSVV